MRITKQARREAKGLFRSCLVNGVLDDNRMRLGVQQLLAKKPRGYLAIATQLMYLLKLYQERRTARVDSASQLSPEMQASIRNNLTRHYGPGLNLSFGQNPELLGGLRIQVGSDVFDGSVKGRLSQLQESF